MTSQQKAKKRHNFENLFERPIEIYIVVRSENSLKMTLP